MAVYAIGDLQGCYSDLCRLLEAVQFDQTTDKLWFCGDLVNRGPDSLQALRFVKSLGDSAVTVLGNHDLHLLALYHLKKPLAESDTLYPILHSDDCDTLMQWLQVQPLLHYDAELGKVLVHAGIHPDWSIDAALGYAEEVHASLRSDNCGHFFANMYGDQPDRWSENLVGLDRLRCITNIFTRLRFIRADSGLDMDAKGGPSRHPDLTPWFEVNARNDSMDDIVFGHWSTLAIGRYGKHLAIDCGCVWGGKLVALRIDSVEPAWTSVNCQKKPAKI